MYTLVNTVVQSYDRTIGIAEISAGDLSIRQLITDNEKVILELTNSHIPGNFTLDLSTVYSRIYSKPDNFTVNQWLTDNGNNTLPCELGKLAIRRHKAKYVDVFTAGFEVDATSGYIHADSPGVLDDERIHLALQKEGVDFREMGNRVLAVVGGYLHQSYSDPFAFYIRNGRITQEKGNTPKINLLSLDKVGDLKTIPLIDCTITPKFGFELSRGITVTVPEDISGKTVWISLAGHLLYAGREYSVMSNRSLLIDWRSLNMHLKYLTSRDFIDLSSVEVIMDLIGDDGAIVDTDKINSNPVIESFLNLSQSFLIVIDNPLVNTTLTRLEDTGLPGKYLAYDDPYALMLASDGRLPPISLINEHRAWVVSTSINQGMVNNYYGETQNPENTNLFTNHLTSTRKHYRSPLYRLDIDATTLEVIPG